MRKKIVLLMLVLATLVVGVTSAQQPPPPPPGGGAPPGGGPDQAPAPEFDENYQPVPNTYEGNGTVTLGSGEFVDDYSIVTECNTGERFVPSETGKITADDGSEWIVPMQVTEGSMATVDIFNGCGEGDNPNYLDDLETVVIDEDGEEVTATIFADNYFELYVNGQFVGRDTTGFVPFNSSAARFQASYPMTIAVHLADWETHFSLGMEYDSYNIGDGGFIASFSNGVVTGPEWKCLPVYIAPLDDPVCVVEDEFGNPDSSDCSDHPQCSSENAEACRALHYELPEEWTSVDFDSSNWADASLYDSIEVTNQRGYVDYAVLFGDAQFIWSSNLDLDNQVLCRITVEAP